MFVFGLHIRRFRGISDLWLFPNRETNVLIGPNNSGKSTILNALRLILDPTVPWWRDDVLTRFDFPAGLTSEPIEIRVWLEAHQNEPQPLVEEIYHRLSKWKVILDCGQPIGLEPLALDPGLQPEELPPHKDLLAFRLHATWDDFRHVPVPTVEVIDEAGIGRWNVGPDMREVIGFRFFVTQRRPVYELSLARNSILSRSVSDKELNTGLRALLDVLENNKAALLNLPGLDSFLKGLQSLAAPQVLQALTGEADLRFTLTFFGASLGRLRAEAAIATQSALGDSAPTALPLECQGDGIQHALLLLHLLQLTRGNQDNVILAVEEPEQHLEPALSRWIFSELSCEGGSEPAAENSGSGDERSSEAGSTHVRRHQVLISTHSPALVGELRGVESLIILRSTKTPQGPRVVCHRGNALPSQYKKAFEQRRDEYANALFARQVLVVEGASERGLLPVAFRALSKGKPYENPFHLGVEIVPGEGHTGVLRCTEDLQALGCDCHALLDYDAPGGNDSQMNDRIKNAQRVSRFVTCWPKNSLLSFVHGCDLEVLLVAQVESERLLVAITKAYSQAPHALAADKWREALSMVEDAAVRGRLPAKFPHLTTLELRTLGDEETQRAFLFACLHGPHDCKSTTDMRTIGESLAAVGALPPLLDVLRVRLVTALTQPDMLDPDVYLRA